MKKLLSVFLLLAGSLFPAVSCSPSSDGGSTCSSRPCTCTVTCSSSVGTITDLDTAYKKLQLGDTLALEAGCTWTGNYVPVLPWNLTRLPGTEGNYVNVVGTKDNKIPTTYRITPAYIPLMPTLRASTSSGNLPVVYFTGGKNPARYVKLRGIYFRSGSVSNVQGLVQVGARQNGPSVTYDLFSYQAKVTANTTSTITCDRDVSAFIAGDAFRVANASGGSAQDFTVASVSGNVITVNETVSGSIAGNFYVRSHVNADSMQPYNIWFDRSIIANPGMSLTAMSKLVFMNSQQLDFTGSWLYGSRYLQGSDNQAILAVQGPGPLNINNTMVGSGTENIMLGGVLPGYDTEVQSGLIEYSYFPHYKEQDDHGPWDRVCNNPGPFGAGFVLKGRLVFPTTDKGASTRSWFEAQGSGIVNCAAEPTWANAPSVGNTIVDGEVTWIKRTSSSASVGEFIKNNFEIKSGRGVNLYYNVFDGFTGQYPWNQQQAFQFQFKAISLNCTNETMVWPDCYRAELRDIDFQFNLVRGQAGGLTIGGGGAVYAGKNFFDNLNFSNNLWLFDEVPDSYQRTTEGFWPYYNFFLHPSGYNSDYNAGTRNSNWTIKNNTFFFSNGFNTVNRSVHFETQAAKFDHWSGTNSFKGNILTRNARAWYGGATSGSSEGNGALRQWPCVGKSSHNDCTTDEFDKNIFIGVANNTTNWPDTNRVFNNCVDNNSCTMNWDYDHPTYGKLFQDTARLDLRVRSDHSWAKRTMPDKSDVGADMNKIPMIRDLDVITTDREILFRYTLPPSVAHIPCVAEVFDKLGTLNMEFLDYVGELDPDEIETYAGMDADDHVRYPRNGGVRYIAFGHSVPLTSLTNNDGGWRLSCGGDSVYGKFTMQDTLAGTQTCPANISEWGYAYNRTTDTITTEVGDPTKGRVIYYRLTDDTTVRMLAIGGRKVN